MAGSSSAKAQSPLRVLLIRKAGYQVRPHVRAPNHATPDRAAPLPHHYDNGSHIGAAKLADRERLQYP